MGLPRIRRRQSGAQAEVWLDRAWPGYNSLRVEGKRERGGVSEGPCWHVLVRCGLL